MASPPQPIDPNSIYPLKHFQQVSGLKDQALRTARSRGLQVRRCGNRCFVLGRDFLQYLVEQGGPQPDRGE